MVEFLQNYGLWVALAGVFVAMHWFGMGCCGGHRHGPRQGSRRDADEDGSGDRKQIQAGTKTQGSCH